MFDLLCHESLSNPEEAKEYAQDLLLEYEMALSTIDHKSTHLKVVIPD